MVILRELPSDNGDEVIDLESDQEDAGMQLIPALCGVIAKPIPSTAAISGSGEGSAAKSEDSPAMENSGAVSGEESAGKSAKEKPGSKRAAQDEAEESTQKKKRKKRKKSTALPPSSDGAVAVGEEAVAASEEATGGDEENRKGPSSIRRVFCEEDEIAILKGVVDFRADTGMEPKSDSDAFYDAVKDSLSVEVTKRQILDKLRKLMKKFRKWEKQCRWGKELVFADEHNNRVFELSKKIWGKLEAETPNVAAAVCEPIIKKPVILGLPSQNASEEDQQVPNMECENEEGLVEADNEGEVAAEPKSATNDCGKVTNVEPQNDEGSDEGNGAESEEHQDDEGSGDVQCEMAAAGESRQATKEHPESSSAIPEEPKEASEEHQDGEGLGNAQDEGVVAEEPQTNHVVVNNSRDGVMDKGGDGVETGVSDADAFWAQHAYLKDAADTVLSKGPCCGFPKELFLEAVRGFGPDKVNEWNEKWRALCLEEMDFEVRKRDFTVKFSKFALEALKKN